LPRILNGLVNGAVEDQLKMAITYGNAVPPSGDRCCERAFALVPISTAKSIISSNCRFD
jgi:hypothetical protein